MLNKLQGWLLGAVTIISVLFGIYLKGKSVAKRDRMISDLESYIDTQERVNETVILVDTYDNLERLSKNDQLRD